MLSYLADILSVGTSTQPASQPRESVLRLEGLTLWLVCIGICVLAAWIVRRVAHKKTIKLLNAPLRPNNLGVFHLFAVILIVLAPIFVSSQLQDSFKDFKTRFFIVSGSAQSLILFAASLICGKLAFRHGLIRGMGSSARRWFSDSIRAVLAYLAVIPVTTGALFLTVTAIKFFSSAPQDIIHEHVLLEAIRNETLMWKAMAFFSAVIIAPFSEELFFRGIIQSLVRYNTRSPWQAILISSFFFAIIHVSYWHTIPAIFVLSLVLGYNYERTGRLWAPIMIHMLFNCVSMLSALGI